MPNYFIDREKFLEIMSQFKGDIPYLQKLFNKVKELLPEEYFKQLVTDQYHSYVYDSDYYLAEHYIYSDDKHYFKDFEQLYEFLKEKNLEKEVILKRNKVDIAMNTPYPISGYKISFVKKKE
jgi:hypothetical protein